MEKNIIIINLKIIFAYVINDVIDDITKNVNILNKIVAFDIKINVKNTMIIDLKIIFTYVINNIINDVANNVANSVAKNVNIFNINMIKTI